MVYFKAWLDVVVLGRLEIYGSGRRIPPLAEDLWICDPGFCLCHNTGPTLRSSDVDI